MVKKPNPGGEKAENEEGWITQHVMYELVQSLDDGKSRQRPDEQHPNKGEKKKKIFSYDIPMLRKLRSLIFIQIVIFLDKSMHHLRNPSPPPYI